MNIINGIAKLFIDKKRQKKCKLRKRYMLVDFLWHRYVVLKQYIIYNFSLENKTLNFVIKFLNY